MWLGLGTDLWHLVFGTKPLWLGLSNEWWWLVSNGTWTLVCWVEFMSVSIHSNLDLHASWNHSRFWKYVTLCLINLKLTPAALHCRYIGTLRITPWCQRVPRVPGCNTQGHGKMSMSDKLGMRGWINLPHVFGLFEGAKAPREGMQTCKPHIQRRNSTQNLLLWGNTTVPPGDILTRLFFFFFFTYSGWICIHGNSQELQRLTTTLKLSL